MKNKGIFFLVAIVLLVIGAAAHDGWIQSNVARARIGDMVYIDMQFGSHGNAHRDYKIYSSKWDLTKASFTLHTPNGLAVDMLPSVIDVGQDTGVNVAGTPYLDKNGYLVTSFRALETGTYITDVRQDMVVSYAPERSIKCPICSSLTPTSSSAKPSLEILPKNSHYVWTIFGIRSKA